MTGRREVKRRKLRHDLLQAAVERIATEGLAKLRARDLAIDVGCALGSLYNVFTDIDDLVLHVNSQTLQALGAELSAAAQDDVARSPADRLVALSHAYLDFAIANPNSWAALFDHQMPEGAQVPEWHLNDHAVLFIHILKPLTTLMPHLGSEDAALTARGLFSAVHGVVSLGLQQRFSAVPADKIREMLTLLVGGFAGSAAAQA